MPPEKRKMTRFETAEETMMVSVAKSSFGGCMSSCKK
jgi:hypothetical protein